MILPGMVFGRLTTIEPLDAVVNSRTKWKCRCECGAFTYPTGNCLKRNNSRSCGCLRRESMRVAGKLRRVHGGYGTPTYVSWSSMKSRCYNKNTSNYPDYGGRGIRVCVRWINSFEAFREDMGERPSLKHSIERIDTDGDYCPENCKWATDEEQNNNKRNIVYYTVDGIRMNLNEVAKRFKIPLATLDCRLKRDGLSIEEAIAKKTNRKFITYKGETKTPTQWARCLGIAYITLRKRLEANVPFELIVLLGKNNV